MLYQNLEVSLIEDLTIISKNKANRLTDGPKIESLKKAVEKFFANTRRRKKHKDNCVFPHKENWVCLNKENCVFLHYSSEFLLENYTSLDETLHEFEHSIV